MKRILQITIVAIILSTLNFQLSTSFAQGTAFTYQGRLNNNGSPANGSYDLTFALFNTNVTGVAIAGPVTNSATSVSNGLFTTMIDFGNAFIGTSNWLEITVRTNGNGAFTTLSPRQQITPTPYAITAENLSGVVENNAIQAGVLLATISGGSGNVIQTGANDSTIGGGVNNNIGTNSTIATIGGGANNSIGTNDDTSTIAGGNGNIIQDGAGVSTIAGGVGNEIQTGSPRSAISGGANNVIFNNSQYSTIGGGDGNQIQNNSVFSTISGGEGNIIQSNASYSAIAGGVNNTIQTNADESVIGGGVLNKIQNNAYRSIISGGYQNTIQSNAWQSIIGGGYQNTIQSNAFLGTIGGGYQNTIQQGADDSAIGGGNGNSIAAFESVVGGGQGNVIETNAVWSAIVGGLNNSIQTNAQFSSIGGGQQNSIQTNAQNDFIGGGSFNSIQTTNAVCATIAGGNQNTNSGQFATVPGGQKNVASGNFSFAAGQQAQATNQGAFVWADSQNAPFASTTNDQFLIRAQGGVGINMNNPNGASLYVQGNRSGGTFNSSVGFFENTSTATGSAGSGPALRVVCDGGSTPAGALSVSDNGTGPIAEFGNGLQFVASIANDGTLTCKSLTQTSDRNAKENFSSLDAKIILAKVAAMPVTEWNYKDDAADKKHIGPMAQDFYAEFGLNGSDDKHISVVDEGGVALAAIQGLNQKLQEELKHQDIENAKLKQQNNLLAERLNELEATVKSLTEKK